MIKCLSLYKLKRENMSHNHQTEKKRCQCYNCGKTSLRVYNFSLGKWARAFKCRCGSESFRWFNY